MDRVKVGVVGVGYLGRYHAEKYANLPQTDLVGVADIDPEKADRVAKQWKTRAFTDYRDLIPHVKAVSIAVPTSLHYTIASDFLKRGIDVLIEKPITTTLEEADDLITLARERNLILQVGHLERFNAAIVATRDIIRNPMFIESHRLAFFQERGTDVDVILDLMIHDIDIILSMVKSRVKEIHAVGVPVISQHIDIANARIEFRNGCVANVTASRISDKMMRKIRIFEPDAYISIDYAAKEVQVYRKIGEASPDSLPEIVSEQIAIEEKDSLGEEIKAFIQSVITRSIPVVAGEAGKEALKVALEIIEQTRVRDRL
jgi:predicted dehydrogenase